MIQVKKLSLVHKKDLHTLINDISFVLNSGDKVAVIGEEGNGKSTLLKAIYNLDMINEYIEIDGKILKKDCIIGYLPQEVENSKKSVYEYITEVDGFWDMTAQEIYLLQRQIGIDEGFIYSDQIVDSLSGGEKIKVQLFRILCCKPNVLLLDEPSNDLDLFTLEWLGEFINNWNGIVMYISHDEVLLEKTANKIIHLEQLKKKRESKYTVIGVSYNEYVRFRNGAIKKQEQLANKEKMEYENQQDRITKIRNKVEYRQEVISRQNPNKAAKLKKKMHSIKSCERRLENDRINMTQKPEVEEHIWFTISNNKRNKIGRIILDMKNVKIQINNDRIIENINILVNNGDKVCIIGKNGCGKTTLLKEIKNELMKNKKIKISYMPQNYEEEMDENSTPIDFFKEDYSKEEDTKIRTYLGSMKFTLDEMNHCIKELSGGQKAKIYFLKLMLDEPDVLLLDEPTRNLSPLSNVFIRKGLIKYNGTIISVSHDRKYIEEVCEKVYTLDKKGLNKKILLKK